MKLLKLSVVILLFVGIALVKAQAISQTEELDNAQIVQKAKADARTDFNIAKTLTWGVGSFLLGFSSVPAAFFVDIWTIPGAILGPIALSYIVPVQLPSERMNELSSRKNEYREGHVESYEKEMRILRVKRSAAGNCLGIVGPLGFMVINGQAFAN